MFKINNTIIIWLLIMFLLINYRNINSTVYSLISGKVIDKNSSNIITKYNISIIDLEAEYIDENNIHYKGVNPPITGSYTMISKTNKVLIKINNNAEYIIELLPPGNYEIYCKANGYLISKREITIFEGKNIVELNFYLEKIGSIFGKIYSSPGGIPLANAKITINKKELNKNDIGPSFSIIKSDENGKYIEYLSNGQYEMIINHTNYAPFKEEFSINNTSNIEKNIILMNKSGKITLRVSNTNLQNINNVDLNVLSENYFKNNSYSLPSYIKKYDNINQTYSITSLDTGSYSINIKAPEYIQTTIKNIKIDFDTDTTIDVILKKGGTVLRGKVIDEDTLEPISGVEVSCNKGGIEIDLDKNEINRIKTSMSVNNNRRSISKKIISNSNNEIEVQLNNDNSVNEFMSRITVMSDFDGKFYFKNLDIGSYIIYGVKEGYFFNMWIQEYNPLNPIKISSSIQELSEIVIKLKKNK